MSKIDLHIHSYYSDDGELSPEQIVSACEDKGMELIAITDHNSVRGVGAAIAAARSLQVLSGIELDCTYGGKGFHLLGYDFDFTRPEFAEIEQDILRQEQEAAETKIQLFHNATGIPVNASDICAAAKDGVVTGELIAELLLSRRDAVDYPVLKPYLPGGDKCDMPNVRFYWDFFSEGKAAYVPIGYLPLADAVALIHSAGGFAVLAHPWQNLGSDDSLLPKIISAGIDGIEAFSSYHTIPLAEHYVQVAQKFELAITCGSDFHGKHKPSIELGEHGAFGRDEHILAQIRHSS